MVFTSHIQSMFGLSFSSITHWTPCGSWINVLYNVTDKSCNCIHRMNDKHKAPICSWCWILCSLHIQYLSNICVHQEFVIVYSLIFILYLIIIFHRYENFSCLFAVLLEVVNVYFLFLTYLIFFCYLRCSFLSFSNRTCLFCNTICLPQCCCYKSITNLTCLSLYDKLAFMICPSQQVQCWLLRCCGVCCSLWIG